MRIAVFASAVYPSLGGVEELTRELAVQYRCLGHHVVILTNRWPRSLPEHDQLDGIDVYRLPFRTPDGGMKARVSYPLTWRSIQKDVASLVAQEGTDVIHVQCVGPNGLYALKGSERLGLPLVVTTQGEITMDSSGLYQRSTFMNRLLGQLCRRADFVTAVSKKTADDLVAQIGFKPEPFRVIYNGTSVKRFARAAPRPHHRPYISAGGRLAPQKGFDVLIRAFAASSADGHDLLIAGSGPEADYLSNLIQDLGLVGRVALIGRLDRDEMASLHAGAEMFVLPSITDEGLPLACVEAMSSGTAVIASRTGGIPEVIDDGVNGLLVDKGDINGLTQAISSLAADRALRERLAAEAGRTAVQLDWEVLAREYVEVFEAVTRK